MGEKRERDASEAIRKHLVKYGVNKESPAYLVRGAELICNQGTNKRMMNLNKCHGVYIKEHAVVHELDCIQGEEENITWFGVCNVGEGLETDNIELIGDNGEKCHGKKCEPHIIGSWQESFEGTRIVDNGDKKQESGEEPEGCNTITTDSFLVCKYGGIIVPINSGQDREVEESEFVEGKDAYDRVMGFICEEEIDREEGCKDLLHAKLSENDEWSVHGSEFESTSDEEPTTDCEIPKVSKKAIKALMELEVLNDYANDLGYLVIEDGRLIGIKPHLVGDGGITVGFGDYLYGDDDIGYYREKGYELSTKPADFDKVKDIVIPVDVCYEKMMMDVEQYWISLRNQIESGDLRMLSQQELDALVIAKYQCNSLGEAVQAAINENKGRDELYGLVLERHGKNGNFDSRTSVEMNIFFDEKYEVDGGLGDMIEVEPWEKFYGN